MTEAVKELADEYMRLLEQSSEVLNPVLARYYSESPFPMIQHPLVYSVPHLPNSNALVNRQYEQKKKAVEESFAEKNWNRYLVMHERPHRPTALADIASEMSDEDYWQNVGWVWSDSENIRELKFVWSLLLGSRRPKREQIMDEKDRLALANMPDELTIYRGCAIEDTQGLSWTLDRERAEWFAERNHNLSDQDTEVKVATVQKSDVIAYITRRNEEEIIVNPKSIKSFRFKVL